MEGAIPELKVELTAAYHLHSIRRMVRDMRPIFDLAEPTIVVLDLSKLTFISPACAAVMVATMRRGRRNGTVANGSQVTGPEAPLAAMYIRRLDVLKVLFEKEPVEIEDPFERHDVKGLKECEHFVSEAGGRKVASALSDALREKVDTDIISATSLDLCLVELTENVHFHAKSKDGGFAAAQSFKTSKEIEVAIVDLGIGIAESLRGNPDYEDEASDDISAIETAIRPLVTSTPERNAGYGLAFTRFLMEANQGRLIVWSGEGWVQFGEHPARKRIEEFPGTLVVLRLHTDRPFDYKRAYAELTRAIKKIEGEPSDDVRTLKHAAS